MEKYYRRTENIEHTAERCSMLGASEYLLRHETVAKDTHISIRNVDKINIQTPYYKMYHIKISSKYHIQ